MKELVSIWLMITSACKFYIISLESIIAEHFTSYRCPSGADGKNCEIAPNRCLGEPCRNNGVCGDFGSRLECTCPKGLRFIQMFISIRY